MDFNQDR